MISYPSRGLYVTTHEEDLFRETDPRVPKVLVPPGGESAYLEESSRTYSGTTADSDSFRAGVRFFPPNPWILKARGAAGRANYAAALSDVEAAEWRVACRVKQLVATVAYLQEDIAQLGELIAARERMAGAAKTLSDEGQVPLIDAVAASQRHMEAIDEMHQQQSELRLADSELRGLVGLAVDFGPVELETLIDTGIAENSPPATALRTQVLENRRDIAAAYWRSQAAEAVLREAKATRIPWFTRIEGSYGRNTRNERPEEAWEMSGGYADLDPLYSVAVDDVEDTEWRIEAVMTIPLFSLGSRATRIQRAEHEQTLAALGEVTRLAMNEMSDSLQAVEQARERMLRLEADVMPQREETAALLEELGARSDVGPLEVDRIREVEIEMARMLGRGRYERVMALLLLEASTGGSLADSVPARSSL